MRMDKLLSNRKHENSADQNRWMVANANANHHLEAMEGGSKANVGTAEAGSTRMDGKTKCRIRRPLSGRSKDNRITSNNKRNPRKARTHQLCRLLFEWNRRMPNGTYGGVRGIINLYSILMRRHRMVTMMWRIWRGCTKNARRKEIDVTSVR